MTANGQSKMRVDCPQCGKALMVAVSAAGKKGRCPDCRHTFEIPVIHQLEAVTPPPAMAVTGLTPLDPSWPEPTAPNYAAHSFGNLNELQYMQASAPALPNYQSYTPPAAAGGQPAASPNSSLANDYMRRAYQEKAESEQRAREPERDGGGFFAPEARGLSYGVLGGLAMMGIAAVWFFAGLAANRIFFYPPILFCIGLFGLVKGLLEGNITGRE